MRLFQILIILSCVIACDIEKSTIPYQPYHEAINSDDLSREDEVIQKLYLDYESLPETQAEKDQNLIINYLTEHKISAIKLPSGLYYKLYQNGDGLLYKPNDPFSARYTGYFLDGKVFDSNLTAMQPLNMKVGEMINGWNEAMTHVSPGSKVSIFIPSHLAYEEVGVKKVIPPNSVLIFDIQL